MELKYYTILTSPNYNNPSLLVKDWNKENYPFGFGGVNHDGTECVWAEEQEVYIKKDVDEAIAELKDENAELKQKLMPCLNGDCILTCEVVEKYGKENAELKKKLDKTIAERDGNQVCIDALKAKLENVQASMYCDVVDANMEIRRLKRALYKACANWADVVAFEETEGIGYDNSVAEKWRKMERKCLKKAEEYK